jgi:hypothetical protein
VASQGLGSMKIIQLIGLLRLTGLFRTINTTTWRLSVSFESVCEGQIIVSRNVTVRQSVD